MMKIKKRTQLSWPETTIIVTLIIGVGLYCSISHYINTGSQSTQGTNSSVSDNVEQSSKTTNSSKATGLAPPNQTSALTLLITSKGQSELTYQIRVLIEPLTSSGNCTLTLKKGSVVIVKTVTVQALPQASTCKGFDIPLSELSAGEWQATVAYADGQQAQEATTNIEVK